MLKNSVFFGLIVTSATSLVSVNVASFRMEIGAGSFLFSSTSVSEKRLIATTSVFIVVGLPVIFSTSGLIMAASAW